jgi:hypothetical protein
MAGISGGIAKIQPGSPILAPMSEDPAQPRWFQFSLATMLIVTAIAAWGVSIKPFRISESTVDRSESECANGTIPVGCDWKDVHGFGGRWNSDKSDLIHFVILERRSLNPHLAWPALALVALLAWKGLGAFRADDAPRPLT